MNEASNAISVDFDVLLEVLEIASKRGAELSKRFDLVLRKDQIEDMMDTDNDVHNALIDALNTAMLVRAGAVDEDEPAGK